jgi:diguanylate cyclase (GGDEF)-like protein/PAS domain S-box-containing protein
MILRKPFRDWPIRHKLTSLLLVAGCITAISASLPMGLFDYFGLRRSMAQDQATLADVLSRNSTAALSFGDAKSAAEVLGALRAQPNVIGACIYNDEGKPFATYVRAGSQFTPPPLQPESTRFHHHRLLTFHKITLAGEQIGTIYIESDLQKQAAGIRAVTIAFLLTLAIALSFSFLMASPLQKPICHPLLNLVNTAKAVSVAGDYSLRARIDGWDEFGCLSAEFNGMLDRIQEQDRQLRLNREHLEDDVRARTAELFVASQRLKLQAAALEAAANAIVITDVQGNIVWTNPAFTGSTGYSRDEATGKNPRLLASGKHSAQFYSSMWQTILAGNVWKGEMINRRKDGSLYTEEMTITPVSLAPGGITHFIAIKQDITDRKAAEEALRAAEERYRSIFADAVTGIYQVTPDGRPLRINRALAQMYGYDSPERFLSEVANMFDLFADQNHLRELKHRLETSALIRGVEAEICRNGGTQRWVLANVRAVPDQNGKTEYLEGTVEDITDRKLAEKQVQYLAYYDILTGLPNRMLLRDRLIVALASARRRREKVAVFFVDLDRFKIINDSLGHTVGDHLLQQVAERLKRWSREQDTVARVGGDEFLIALTAVREVSDAATAADRLVRSLTSEFNVDGHVLTTTCSIGISIFPDQGEDVETLIKNADAAMYSAKESGRNTFRVFTDEMNAQVVERMTMESYLRQAFDKHQFFLMYQPQVEITTGKITAFEALVRWMHPVMGLIPPDRFIRIAENSGLIVPLGEWVLRAACKEARRWQSEGIPVPVAVNVSAVQFREEGFQNLIKRILAESDLAPQFLELELTESVLLSNADAISRVLDDLKEMGLRLAIDDFGIGYSSLSYLRQLPVGKLKIDRSFIRNIADNSDDAAITSAIISIAKRLNLQVTAEGVETEAQVAFLLRHECDQMQGFYFHPPIMADEAMKLLRESVALVPREALIAASFPSDSEPVIHAS